MPKKFTTIMPSLASLRRSLESSSVVSCSTALVDIILLKLTLSPAFLASLHVSAACLFPSSAISISSTSSYGVYSSLVQLLLPLLSASCCNLCKRRDVRQQILLQPWPTICLDICLPLSSMVCSPISSQLMRKDLTEWPSESSFTGRSSPWL